MSAYGGPERRRPVRHGLTRPDWVFIVVGSIGLTPLMAVLLAIVLSVIY